jgi:hypothetical protein
MVFGLKLKLRKMKAIFNVQIINGCSPKRLRLAQHTRYSGKKYSIQDLDIQIKIAEEIILSLKQVWEILYEISYFE